MRMRSRFGVGADWPLDYAELEPFYREVEELLGVAGPLDSGARWRSAPYPQPAHPLSLASRWLGRGAAALGLSWQANPRCALSKPLDGRPACNYCGGCTHGCPRRDKGSTDVTFVAKARASGRCEVRTGLQVRRIEAEAASRVQAIVVSEEGAGGRTLRIPARRLVLACGAVETPRLLLLQRGARRPRGLANDSNQVGRNFMESVTWTSLAAADVPLMSFGGLPADSICWDYNAPDAVPGQVGGFRLSAAVHEADMVGAIAHAQRAVPGFGRAHKEQMRKLLGSVVAIGATGESLPNNPADSLGRTRPFYSGFFELVAGRQQHNAASAATPASVVLRRWGRHDRQSCLDPYVREFDPLSEPAAFAGGYRGGLRYRRTGFPPVRHGIFADAARRAGPEGVLRHRIHSHPVVFAGRGQGLPDRIPAGVSA